MIKKIIWVLAIVILLVLWIAFYRNFEKTTNQANHEQKPEHYTACIDATKNKMNDFMSTEWSTFQGVTFEWEEETLSWYNEFWVVSYEKDWVSEKGAVYCKVDKNEEAIFIQISPREFEDTRLFYQDWRKNLCDEYLLDTLKIKKATINWRDESDWWNDFNRKGNVSYLSWDQEISNNANCFINMVYWFTVIHVTDSSWKSVANKEFSQKAALQENCIINWWKIETKWEKEYCVLPDNSSCEIQDYYNSECHTLVEE